MNISVEEEHESGWCLDGAKRSREISRVTAAAIEFAKIGGVQPQGHIHAGFISGFFDFKTGLVCRNDQCPIGNVLACPIFNDMLHPKTAELRWVCHACPAEPLTAKINLLLGDRRWCITAGVGSHNSQWTDFQCPLVVCGDGVAHDVIRCQGSELESLFANAA